MPGILHRLPSAHMSQKVENVIIIGSGPAGYTAALYAGRADLSPLMFSGQEPGGQLMITTEVENYPGFPQGILGPEIMELFKQQAERFGTKIEPVTVTKVDFTQRPFTVTTDTAEYTAASIIVSTGATAKWLGIPSEVEFGGFGVSACATCDGFFFRGKNVMVVGGGDTAMEEAARYSHSPMRASKLRLFTAETPSGQAKSCKIAFFPIPRLRCFGTP